MIIRKLKSKDNLTNNYNKKLGLKLQSYNGKIFGIRSSQEICTPNVEVKKMFWMYDVSESDYLLAAISIITHAATGVLLKLEGELQSLSELSLGKN